MTLHTHRRISFPGLKVLVVEHYSGCSNDAAAPVLSLTLLPLAGTCQSMQAQSRRITEGLLQASGMLVPQPSCP